MLKNATRTLLVGLSLAIGITFFVYKQHKAHPTAPLIFDHDGGIDDVIAFTLQLMQNPNRIKAITIAPADCYDKPAVWTMQEVLELLAPTTPAIPIGLGSNEGVNPFPPEWRDDAWKFTGISLWGNKRDGIQDFSVEHTPTALTVMAKALDEATSPVVIVETGPCSNIAELLEERPELAKKISRIFIMGGALYVKGNVAESGHDKSAEWNIYNNPQAFHDVLSSRIPVTLIPLDATQYTPIRQEFMTYLEQHCHIKACRMVYEGLQTIRPFIDNGEYLFWDTLTSAAAINPAIITTKKIKVNVVIDGPSMGKTFEDPNGFEIDVALWADQALFEKTILAILESKPTS